MIDAFERYLSRSIDRNTSQVATILHLFGCRRRHETAGLQDRGEVSDGAASDVGTQGLLSRVVDQITEPHLAPIVRAQNDDIGMCTGIETLHTVQIPAGLGNRLSKFDFLSVMIEIRMLPVRAAATVTTQKQGEAGRFLRPMIAGHGRPPAASWKSKATTSPRAVPQTIRRTDGDHAIALSER